MSNEQFTELIITTLYLVAFASLWLFRGRQYPADLWSISISIALIAFGAGTWLAGRMALGSAHATVPKAKALVTDGVYCQVRHPMYIGLQLMFWGLCLWFGSLIGFVASFVIVLPLSTWRARAEERVLERAFGKKYSDYKSRTKL